MKNLLRELWQNRRVEERVRYIEDRIREFEIKEAHDGVYLLHDGVPFERFDGDATVEQVLSRLYEIKDMVKHFYQPK